MLVGSVSSSTTWYHYSVVIDGWGIIHKQIDRGSERIDERLLALVSRRL